MSRSCVRAALLALACLPAAAFAHHGQDFLLVESPAVPHPGDVYLLTDAHAALDADTAEQAGVEPALLVGATHRFAFELHGHLEKTRGDGWRYEATAPSVHVLLSDPERHDGVQVGLSAEYEIARERGEPDNAALRLSFAQRGDVWSWGANLIAEHEQHGDTDTGAAFALRRRFSPRFALGGETRVGFDRAVGNETLLVAGWQREDRWAIKLGVGGLRTDDRGVVPVVHAAWVLQLKD